MKTLVILNEVPDRTRLYVLDDVSPTDQVMLDNLQGVVINQDELTEVQNAACELFSRYVDGHYNDKEDKREIPIWVPAVDSNEASWALMKQRLEDCKPDKIYVITLLC